MIGYSAIPVILGCFTSVSDRRNFGIWVDDLKMNTDEYVYIFADTRAMGMNTQSTNGSIYYWQSTSTPPDGKDAQALRTAYKSLILDLQNMDVGDSNAFKTQMLNNIGNAPFNCNGTCMGPDPTDYTVSVYANYLHDAMYLYALTINRTMTQYGVGPSLRDILRNGSFLTNMSRGSFAGRTGYVKIDANGTRWPIFWVTGLNTQSQPTVWLNISIEGSAVTTTPQYSDESVVWASRANQLRPPDTPICGFSGTSCPVNVALYLAVGGAVLAGFLAVALAGVGFAVREKFREQERLDRECLINSIELLKLDLKNDKELKSQRSFHSSTTASSGDNSGASVINSVDAARLEETEHHAFFKLSTDRKDEELVYAEKYAIRVKLSRDDMKRLRRLRQFDHDNVNKFLGISIDGVQPGIMALWKYCHRGSLQDVIAKESYVSDAFVAFTLMRDIINVGA